MNTASPPPPIALADAQARLLGLAPALPPERLPVNAALGRYLAEPLLAARTQPAADLSAMDGYALSGDGPWRVIGESAAGHPFDGSVRAGEAVRISTGALMPAGADIVLLQEDALRAGDRLEPAGDAPVPGRHIRRAGFDFARGDELMSAGARITPAMVALGLAAGHAELAVHRAPSIAIIDSGDELAANPADCPPHRIPASNGAMLQALLAQLPCAIRRIGPVADDIEALADALAQAADADIVVTSGGASVGDHDLIRPALEAWGAHIDFWRVAIKPGKPLLVARRGHQLVLGLPGNPVSGYVTAFLFLLPLVRRLAGSACPLPVAARIPSATALAEGGSRMEFLRAHWDGASVTPVSEQDSSALRALSQANALIERPIGAPAVAAHAPVTAYLFGNGGIA